MLIVFLLDARGPLTSPSKISRPGITIGLCKPLDSSLVDRTQADWPLRIEFPAVDFGIFFGPRRFGLFRRNVALCGA